MITALDRFIDAHPLLYISLLLLGALIVPALVEAYL
jgi:hypothetical protein